MSKNENLENDTEESSGSIFFVADSDSQLKPAYRLTKYVADQMGWSMSGNLLPGRVQASKRQIETVGVECPLHNLELDELAPYVSSHTVVVAFLPGSKLYLLQAALSEHRKRRNLAIRPLIVTGYNGVVYEKHLEGLLWRVGYDFITVNSQHDLDLFTRHLNDFNFPTHPLVVTGLLLAQGKESCVTLLKQKASEPIKQVLFACQAAVPKVRIERRYLLKKFVEYARRHPTRKILVKPRTVPGEETFHRQRHHYQHIYNEEFRKNGPPNLEFVYDGFETYLPKTDLVVSVSSTAILEAAAFGVRTAILTDLGIKEAMGNHFFAGSGLFTTMADLMADRIPEADENWFATHGLGGDVGFSNLVAELKKSLRGTPPVQESAFLQTACGPKKMPYQHKRIIELSGPRPEETRIQAFVRKSKKLVWRPRRFFVDARSNRAKKRRASARPI